jgi:hypothetical protein
MNEFVHKIECRKCNATKEFVSPVSLSTVEIEFRWRLMMASIVTGKLIWECSRCTGIDKTPPSTISMSEQEN